MQRICGTLAEAGYDVILVGRKLKSSLPSTGKNYKQQRLTCWFTKGKLFYAEFNIRLFFFSYLIKRIVFVQSILILFFPVYYISKLKGIKKVYDAHEYFSQLDEVVSRPNIYRFWYRIEKKMVPKFKKDIQFATGLAEEFKKNYGCKL